MEDSAAYKSSCPDHSANSNMCKKTLIAQQSSSSASSVGSKEKESLSPSPSTPTSQRRAIFDNFWKKSSSIRDDNDSTQDSPVRRSNTTKVEPSYLGIYSFAPPSPLTSPKPVMSAVSSPSDDSLSPSPRRPKSILRRHHSARGLRIVHPIEEEEVDGKQRSQSVCSQSEIGNIEDNSILKLPFVELPFAPRLYEEGDTDSLSKESSCVMSHHSVHFDPTITIREVVGRQDENDTKSNWFNEEELQTFFREAVHLCHASAINSIKVRSYFCDDVIYISSLVLMKKMCIHHSLNYALPRHTLLQRSQGIMQKLNKLESKIQSLAHHCPSLELCLQNQYCT